MTEPIILGTSERWKPIHGAKGYWISTLGQVLKDPPKVRKRGRRNRHKFIQSVAKPWGVSTYWTVRLTIQGKRRCFFVHRLIAEAFIPNPENKPEVNHKDGNKLNSVLWNLEWATTKENYEHAVSTGLRGTWGDYQRKLTMAQARKIRSLYPQYSQTALQGMFGVDQTSISDIILGKTYREVV